VSGLPGPPARTDSWFRSDPGPAPPAVHPGSSSTPAPPAIRGSAAVASNPPAASPSNPPIRKTAKFIATEAAQSGLKLAEDGKLPSLHLKEAGRAEAKEAGSSGANPLLLFGVLAFSVIATVILVFLPTESDAPGKATEKQAARREIEENYIAGMDKEAALAPYQIHLREALQARSRRDFAEERWRYRRVLDMLRAERGKFDRGLTGSPAKDETLEKLITTLLSE
jgi:hypothetical protein